MSRNGRYSASYKPAAIEVARCDRLYPPKILLPRALRTRRTAAVPWAEWAGVMEPVSCLACLACRPGVLAQGDAVAQWPLGLVSSLIAGFSDCSRVSNTDRRLAVIRFMVILIALSIAQFLTAAATVSPSDTHI